MKLFLVKQSFKRSALFCLISALLLTSLNSLADGKIDQAELERIAAPVWLETARCMAKAKTAEAKKQIYTAAELQANQERLDELIILGYMIIDVSKGRTIEPLNAKGETAAQMASRMGFAQVAHWAAANAPATDEDRAATVVDTPESDDDTPASDDADENEESESDLDSDSDDEF